MRLHFCRLPYRVFTFAAESAPEAVLLFTLCGNTRGSTVPGMADRHRTPVRSVRVPDDLWKAVKRIASDRGETVTEVIVQALRRYVREHPGGDR